VKTLVVGGSGFIGAHLIRQLRARGEHVVGLSRLLPSAAQLQWMGDPAWRAGSFLDQDVLARELRGVQTCYHLASSTVPRTSNLDPIADVQVNLCGTINLLTAAAAANVKKVVFASSGGTVYGRPTDVPIAETSCRNPINSYGIVKVAIEQYCEMFRQNGQLDFSIVRLSNPYGPLQRPEGAQGVVAVFLHRIMNNLPVEVWGDGSAIRDYIYIDDAIAGLLAAAAFVGDDPIFNIGSGVGLSILEIVAFIEQTCGRKANIKFLPAGKLDIPTNILSVAKAKRLLGFGPSITILDGLARTAAHLSSAT